MTGYQNKVVAKQAATHCYVGTMPCGCNVAAVVDEPDHPKDVAASIGRFVMDGYSVERVALVDLHDGVVKLSRCRHKVSAQ